MTALGVHSLTGWVVFDDVTLDATAGGPPVEAPEPATMALLGLAACGLGAYVRLSRAKPRGRRRKA